MNSHIPSVKPTQIDVELYIARAHRLRNEYFAQVFTSGFRFLRELVAQKSTPEPTGASARPL